MTPFICLSVLMACTTYRSHVACPMCHPPQPHCCFPYNINLWFKQTNELHLLVDIAADLKDPRLVAYNANEKNQHCGPA